MASPPWTNVWTPSSPADSDLANTLGTVIRTFKLDVTQRMAYQHVWNKDVNTDGAHINILFSDSDTIANQEIFKSGGYSLTGSDAHSMFELAGTWNTSGTPTAFRLNMLDTASNAASLLMDLQVGGVSKFSVSKSGVVLANGSPVGGIYNVGFGTYSTILNTTLTTGTPVGPTLAAVDTIIQAWLSPTSPSDSGTVGIYVDPTNTPSNLVSFAGITPSTSAAPCAVVGFCAKGKYYAVGTIKNSGNITIKVMTMTLT